MGKSMQIEYLNKGDKVAIVSIAKYISNEECDYAYNYITNKGYKVVSLNKTILKKRGMFSAGSYTDNLDNLFLIQALLFMITHMNMKDTFQAIKLVEC